MKKVLYGRFLDPLTEEALFCSYNDEVPLSSIVKYGEELISLKSLVLKYDNAAMLLGDIPVPDKPILWWSIFRAFNGEIDDAVRYIGDEFDGDRESLINSVELVEGSKTSEIDEVLTLAEKIINIHDIMDETEDILVAGPATINYMKIKADLEHEYLEVGEYENVAVTIFDRIIPSPQVPYIQYPDMQLYKLYKNFSDGRNIDYRSYVKGEDKHTLDLIVDYRGLGHGEDIIKVKLDLRRGTLTSELSFQDNREFLIQLHAILSDAFADIFTLTEFEQGELDASVELYSENADFQFLYCIFDHYCMFTEPFSMVLSDIENVIEFPFKNRKTYVLDTFRYMNMLPTELKHDVKQYRTKFRISVEKYTADDIDDVDDVDLDLNEGKVYTKIIISNLNAPSEQLLHDIISNISSMLGIYYKYFIEELEQYDESKPLDVNYPIPLYRAMLGNLNFENEIEFPKVRSHVYKEFSHILGTKHAGCPYPPIISKSHSRIAALAEEKGRTYMRYPAAKPELYFYCDHDTHPFPGFRVDKNPDNPKHACLPCCYEQNQIGKPSYKKCYGMSAISTRSRKAKLSSEEVLAGSGREAALHDSISSMLENSNIKDVEYLRIGVQKSPGSLLHAVLIAIGHYRHQDSDLSKEGTVIKLRTKIAAAINPSLLKQEMYDESEEKIRANLGDGLVFLDSRLYYRALEEYFNINIYVIEYNSELSEYTIQIPKHKRFHIRVFRPERYTILLFKNSRNDHYENIAYKNDYGTNYIFTAEMTILCHKIIEERAKIKTFIPGGGYLHNTYNIADYFSMLYGSPFEQMIDGEGKLQALNFNYEGEMATILCPPSQPLNLPLAKNIHRISLEKAVRMLVPSSLTRDGRAVVGVWGDFMGVRYAFYIPVLSDLSQLPETVHGLSIDGPPEPALAGEDRGQVSRLIKMRITIDIIKTCLTWLRSISINEGENLEDFVGLFYVDEEEVDSADYYEIGDDFYLLPPYDNMIDALQYLEMYFPTLVIDGRIRMYSEKFSASMSSFLRNTVANFSASNIDLGSYHTMRGIYKQYPNTNIYSSKYALNKMSEDHEDKTNVLINEHLQDYHFLLSPYLYKSVRDTYYIIQCGNDHTLEGALKIAWEWENTGINVANRKPNMELPSELKYAIYGIGNDGSLELFQDETSGSELYLEVLVTGTILEFSQIGSKKYAAMLNISEKKI